MSYYLGIDIGGTRMRAAVADDETVISDAEEPTPSGSKEGEVVATLHRLIQRVCGAAGIAPDTITAAGIGSVGPIDPGDGSLVEPANIDCGGHRIRLVDPLRELLGTDAVVLRNDAVCGVIAERHASADSATNLVYLTLSTGIGAGVVVDGNVLSGHRGNAAEVGHMTVDPSRTMACGCGRRGHWEAYCGGANIPHYAAHLERERSVDTGLAVDNDAFGAKDVFDNVGEDELADLVVERVGQWNAIGVANVVQTFAPTRVVVGGAVALNNPDTVLEPIRARISEHVMLDVPELGLSTLGEDVVMQGALLIARRHASS